MKVITLPEVGEVTIKKSRKAKRLILKITQSGEPRVVVPYFAPYALGERFAREHYTWFIKNKPTVEKLVIKPGKVIGWHYQVDFKMVENTKISSRITGNSIVIKYPQNLGIEDIGVQNEAKKACTRALKNLAEAELPGLLHGYAKKYGYKYREVRIKTVKTRWGSCSNKQIINLSIWLMQLNDDLKEYVLCHELTHLNHMHHQADFWEELARMVPDYKLRRKALKEHRPDLI